MVSLNMTGDYIIMGFVVFIELNIYIYVGCIVLSEY